MIYNKLVQDTTNGIKKLAVLIDPSSITESYLREMIPLAEASSVDYFFVGGSLMINDNLDVFCKLISETTDIPVILFPGSVFQLSKYADAVLFLSLISGRNPEALIGNHVIAAPLIKSYNLETLSTGYMLIDGGNKTSVAYMSNTQPIPHEKKDIAVCTALAGEMLGMRILYLDAGSGAEKSVSLEMIQEIKEKTSLPLIVGGGIRTVEVAQNMYAAGADIIVIGNGAESNKHLITDIGSQTKHLRHGGSRYIESR